MLHKMELFLQHSNTFDYTNNKRMNKTYISSPTHSRIHMFSISVITRLFQIDYQIDK